VSLAKRHLFPNRHFAAIVDPSFRARVHRFVATIALITTACGAAGGNADQLLHLNGGEDKDSTPLTRMVGWDWFGGGLEEPTIAQGIEARIAGCMDNAGFEYVPLDYAGAYEAVGAYRDRDRLSAFEYAATYGYGISSGFNGTFPQVVVPNPNVSYLESLDDEVRAEYEVALWGSQVDRQTEDAVPGGCTGRALDELFVGNAHTAIPLLAELTDRIRGDGRMVAGERAWSACMAAQGFEYLTPDEPRKTAMEALIHAAVEELDPGWSPDLEGFVHVEIQADLLENLVAREIETAVADQACQDQVQLSQIEFDVRTDLEGDFIADNGELFDS